MDKVKVSDKLLLSVEKPARYTGGELNSIVKETARLRFALCFPDVYEIQFRNSWDFRNHIFLKSQLFFYLENGLASHRHS